MKIAFIGHAGSGKTTIAHYMSEYYGYYVRSFATPVKEFASEILLRPIDKTDPKDRKFLQYLGTELGRARDPDIWIKHFNMEMQNLESDSINHVIVDDCRFINEADYLKSMGFVLIRLVGRQSEMTKETSNHSSETEQTSIECDFELDNSKDLEITINELKKLVKL